MLYAAQVFLAWSVPGIAAGYIARAFVLKTRRWNEWGGIEKAIVFGTIGGPLNVLGLVLALCGFDP